MRTVQQPLKFSEFKNKHFAKTEEEVTKVIKEIASNSTFKNIKWFLISGILTILLGIVLMVILFTLVKNNTGIIVSLGVGIGLIIVGSLLIKLWTVKVKQLKSLILKELKQKRMFLNLLKELNLKLIRIEDLQNNIVDEKTKSDFVEHINKMHNPISNFEKSLKGLGGIPNDAQIVKKNDQIAILDEWSNTWVGQQITFQWQRTSSDLKGNITVQTYNKDVYAFEGIYLNVHENDNLNFSIGTRTLVNYNHYSNTKLENKEFNKMFNVYTNDQLKIRKAFTPLSMEVLLNHVKENKNAIPSLFGMTYINGNVKAWFIPTGQILYIDLPTGYTALKTIVRQVTNDLIKDVYLLYWIVSFMNTPPMFY
ncbi:DUF3137 domain-containing protein [Mycoplasmopsis columbina]|uniref:DUF3137 domain-containing protein n=1 Tax=Mycoplasmopsis columbina SF7 TaxID=1037410 RepID=F9UKH8_9BACT|nr:DUF3137 domain-containing protein [Mycoplasmopsis columbina]EGV00183.1 hypothetical protein MCSF7_01956 [Mycoplasmopsis columbina SF7]VEU77076.1 Protein of uncharacterised function (DUF3137) [Mycoplasmopsis columbina]